ncbi:MAG: tripartite tricarboxylate transporter substrate binding protein [Pigmentiphaga sp.]|uniref:Bug family tripartite tricarboxylate transporter substrate binding protein n=1 Tax=Pigmentiphaga sp. TaxID=1977564 RepID=UPI0029BA5E08|nr:tripartite tricarboxylate transporter substrate binding protein [Pigmentiphaga sp.]MDX3904781.1 tripartite tricarboxylate transporter substrate binding protein [Pigmentiphaga sp.]
MASIGKARRSLAVAARYGAVVAVALLGAAWAPARGAEDAFPSRVVRIVPYGPGGSPIDVLARAYAERLRQIWGQPVVVDPRPGASGILAADAVAKAPADGYTLLITLQTTHINNAILHEKLPYDPVKDFQPLSQLAIGSGPVLVAPKAAQFSSLRELVDYAAKRPSLTYGTWGNGTIAHLFGELFKQQAVPGLIHVPYKTESTAHQDMEAGRLDLAWANPGTARTMSRAGRMKVLGVPGRQRTEILSDVPTFLEQGFQGFELEGWIGAYAPAGIPQAVRDKLVSSLQAATRSPEVAARIVDIGFRPVANTPEEFAANARIDYARFKQLVDTAGMKPGN